MSKNNRSLKAVLATLLFIVVAVISVIIFYSQPTAVVQPPKTYSLAAIVVNVDVSFGDTTNVQFSDGTVLRIWQKQAPVLRYYLNRTITINYTYVDQDIVNIYVEGER